MRFMALATSTLMFVTAVIHTGVAEEYVECKIIKKRLGLRAADYKFQATDAHGKKKMICVKGKTINENTAKQECRKGGFDDESDCENWDE